MAALALFVDIANWAGCRGLATATLGSQGQSSWKCVLNCSHTCSVTLPTAHTGANHTRLPKHGIISERTSQPIGSIQVKIKAYFVFFKYNRTRYKGTITRLICVCKEEAFSTGQSTESCTMHLWWANTINQHCCGWLDQHTIHSFWPPWLATGYKLAPCGTGGFMLNK